MLINRVFMSCFRQNGSAYFLITGRTYFSNVTVLFAGRFNSYRFESMILFSYALGFCNLAAFGTIHNSLSGLLTGCRSRLNPNAGSNMSMLGRNLVNNRNISQYVIAVFTAEIAGINADAYVGKLNSGSCALAVCNLHDIHRSQNLNCVNKRELSAINVRSDKAVLIIITEVSDSFRERN